MNLNKTDILVLKALGKGPQKTSELAGRLNLSRSRTSAILSKLVKQQLVEKKGWIYSIGRIPQAKAIHLLLKKQPSLALEKILPKTELKILKLLYSGPKTIKELSLETSKTERTIYYKIGVFRSMGIVNEIGGSYILNKKSRIYVDIEPLITDTLKTTSLLYLEDEDSWVVWSGEDEYIIKTKNPTDSIRKIESEGFKWKYTSTSVAGEYGMNIISPETTIYVYKKEGNLKIDAGEYVCIEDAIIHLFLEKNKNAEEYSKWLIQTNKEKVNLSYIREVAKKYGVSEIINNLFYDLKPTLDRVKYNIDRIRALLKRLSQDEDSDFSVSSELENYWRWIEIFGRGEKLDREEDIMKVVNSISAFQPPLFNSLPAFHTWRRNKDHEACFEAGKILLQNAELAFDKKWYWTAIWCFKKAVECRKQLSDKKGLATIIDKLLDLVHNQDFPIHHRLSLIRVATDNIQGIEDKNKKKLLEYLLLTAKRYHALINKEPKNFGVYLNLERRLLQGALKIAQNYNDDALVKKIRYQTGLSHETEGDLKDVPLVSSINYEDALREYIACGDKGKQAELKKKIESSLSKVEYKEISMSTNLDFSIYDRYIEDLAKRKPIEILASIASDETYVPDMDSARKTAEEIAKNTPFTYLALHVHIHDNKPVSKSSTSESILDSEVKTQFMLDASLKAMLYMHAISHMIKNNRFNQTDLKNFLEGCNVSPNISSVVSSAFERHLAKDNHSSITLLVTQIEALLREILKEEGVATTTPINSDFGLKEATLGALLDIPETRKILGENFTYYLQIYLCDQEHENIRNKVAHGLMKPYEYTPEVSLRLLWIMLHLAIVKYRLLLKQES
ncbi:MAG: hypothetical protein A7315_06200 [Candidatus Altiarchaeales archaeon WOR_SM1_79]|nr:MAG: hypothetical protein A7315_06200 [Candidatus Altiarchaeales archaeon WOR_SM1_79]